MILLISSLLIYQALCLFMLAMPKYTKALGREFKPSSQQSTGYRLGAWLLIAVSITILTLENGFSNALVSLCGLVTVLACLLTVLFEKKPFYVLVPVIPNKQPLSVVFVLILGLELTGWYFI